MYNATHASAVGRAGPRDLFGPSYILRRDCSEGTEVVTLAIIHRNFVDL